ncbi:hypothetical protein K8R03_04675 [Candidatus Kaiserbacteria bacterium]|nr:hypothetical protein [Candidatus Kaiserbacteria bacterium]
MRAHDWAMYRSGRRAPFTRGASVLAALVFVALLSAVAYGVHALSPGKGVGQTAAAADAAKVTKMGASATSCGKEATAKENEKIQDQCVPGCEYAVSGSYVTNSSGKLDAAAKVTPLHEKPTPGDLKCHVYNCGSPVDKTKCKLIGSASGSDDFNSILDKSVPQSIDQQYKDIRTALENGQKLDLSKLDPAALDKINSQVKQDLDRTSKNIDYAYNMAGTGTGTITPAMNDMLKEQARQQTAYDAIQKYANADPADNPTTPAACDFLDPNCRSTTPAPATTPCDYLDPNCHSSSPPVTSSTGNDPVVQKPGCDPEVDPLCRRDSVAQGPCPDGSVIRADGTCPATSAPQGPCPDGSIISFNGTCPTSQSQCTPACSTFERCVAGRCQAVGPGTGTGTGTGTGAGTGAGTGTGGILGGGTGSQGGLGGLLQSFMKGLGFGGQQNGQPPIGNQVPQAPGTCLPNYVCQNSTMYLRNTQCVDQIVQNCQYGCSGGQCATSSQTQCPTPPVQPDASQCPNGAWQQQMTTIATGQSCLTGWKCVPGAQPMPTASLSCSPAVIDIGMSVTMSYSCGNSVKSQGQNFSTLGALSGSTSTPILSLPQGATTADFGVACIDSQNRYATSTCSVQVARPNIVLAANPKTVASGGVSLIGWTTSGMSSCVVSSPDSSVFTSRNANATSTTGAATTTPVTADMRVVLTCTTLGGNTKRATTTVNVSQNTGSVTVSSSADGSSRVRHGSTVTIQWATQNPPTGSAMSLWLFDLRTNAVTGLIAGRQGTSGSYTWTIPANGAPCAADSPAPCAGDLVAGRQYGIEAALYTPVNAYLGGLPQPGAPDPQYIDFGYTEPPFTVSQ